MENLELLQSNQPESLENLADRLDQLQSEENDGRGISCVRAVITYLRMGRLTEAKTICFTDSDKIRNYPEVQKFIKDNLFKPEEEHPWSVEERLSKEN